MQEVFLSDNAGNRSAPTPESSAPKTTQTAQKLTQATAGTNTTATVTAGQRYRFTAYLTGGFLFALATTATEGNIRWVCPIYHSIEFTIPIGYTTLHYTTDVNNGVGYLVALDN